jgi:hypothetical protein
MIPGISLLIKITKFMMVSGLKMIKVTSVHIAVLFLISTLTLQSIAGEKEYYPEGKVIKVHCLIKDPEVSFAMEELKNVFTADGYIVQDAELKKADISLLIVLPGSDFNKLQGTDGYSGFKIKPEGFTITKNKKGKIYVSGGGSAGLMYGILELAEQVRLYGIKGVKDTEKNPYMEKRGIKFNIPLDVRTPSYSDMSDAGQVNIPEMWNFDFWKETIDNLARNRFNLISLWSLHPFPSMVKVPEYPDIALDDVKRSTAKLSENYSTRASDINTPEITRNAETVLKITMDEKIIFWQRVMRYAAERNIRFYIMTWNIYINGIEGKYGITDDMNNQTTRDYFRKSVKQMFLTYPDLAGIGVTTGENMGKGGEGFELKEDWVYDTYASGILDVLKEQPERKITFIHRQHEAGTKYIIQKFVPVAENKNIEFLFSFKYAQAHVFSSVKQSFHTSFVKEIAGRKTLWTLRNDDNYYFRWGAPDFVREFIKNIPHDVSAGFYYGSDNYIWGKDFLSLDPVKSYQTETTRQWYQWMIWGRLGYDPDLDNNRFTDIIGNRFPGIDAGKLFMAWQNASMVYPVTTGFHWGDLDYKWYIEGCKSRSEPAQTASGFHDVNRFITLPPHKESGYQSIPDYVSSIYPLSPQGVQVEKREPLKTPPEVAFILNDNADNALILIKNINAGGNKELSYILNDIESMAYLGKYYSCKINGAANLALFRKTGSKSIQDIAVIQLTEALNYWELYTASALKQYKNPLWTNRVGIVDWIKLTGEVKNDIETAKQAK